MPILFDGLLMVLVVWGSDKGDFTLCSSVLYNIDSQGGKHICFWNAFAYNKHSCVLLVRNVSLDNADCTMDAMQISIFVLLIVNRTLVCIFSVKCVKVLYACHESTISIMFCLCIADMTWPHFMMTAAISTHCNNL